MDWIIAGFLGLLVGWIFSIVYQELTKPKEKDPTIGDFMNHYNKSADHYRDGDNT